MGVSVRAIDLTQLRLFRAEDMTTLARKFLDASAHRVAAGIGSDGAPMKSYASSTVRHREKAGYETAYRNLDETTQMLADRVVRKVTDMRARIGFNTRLSAKIAAITNASTPWVKPTDSEDELVRALAEKLANANLRTEQARLRAEKG